MRLDFCVICGSRDELQHHHLVPKVRGGTDDEDNLITLCYKHHCWFHEVKPSKWTRQSELVKEGLARAKLQGVNPGRKTDPHLNALIHQIRSLPLQRPPSYSIISRVLFLCGYKTGKGKPLQREFIYKHYTTWEKLQI